jgi:hypothetical protein
MTTTIRGYGLPNEAASSYNGYAGYGNGANCCVQRSRPRGPLYDTLPDPELGDAGFGSYGSGRVESPYAYRFSPTPTRPAAGGGTVALGLGALALFFFLR